MKKKTIVVLSILAIIIIPLFLKEESLNNLPLQTLIFLPMRFIYDLIIFFGKSGDALGNFIAWFLLFTVSIMPLLILWRINPALLKQKGVNYLILSVIAFFLTVIYFQNSYSINYLGTEIASDLMFYISASMWYLTYLVIFYDEYLRKYEGADEAKYVLSMVVGVVIIYLSLEFTLETIDTIRSFDTYYISPLSLAPLLLEVSFFALKRVLVIRLLWLFNEALLLSVQNWFTLSFVDVLSNIKKTSKGLLSFSIYYPILQIIVRYFGLKYSLDPQFSVNLPFLEIALSLVIIVISEVITFGINYKEENESFV